MTETCATPSIDAGQVVVRTLATDLMGPVRLRLFEALLHPEEIVRADRFVQAKDRRDWVAARGLLRDTVAGHLRMAPGRISFKPDAAGRPYVLVDDERLPGIDVTISHTRGLAACGLGVGCQVGVDAEKIDGRSYAELVPVFFAPAEVAWLASRPAPTAGEDFLRIWTLKEAVVKAEGSGLDFDLASMAVLPDPPRLHTTPPALAPQAGWRLMQWHVTGRHVVALAYRGRPGTPVCVDRLDMDA